MKRSKKRNRVLLAALLVLSILMLSACGAKTSSNGEAASGATEVALVCSAAGKNDNGYNQSAIEGLTKVASELKIAYKVVETSDALSVPDALKQMASGGVKLIFSLEYDFDALIKGVGGEKPLAEQFPDTTFVVFNAQPNVDEAGKTIHKNVISVLFNVHESSYLAGYLSVLVNENLGKLFDAAAYGFDTDQAKNRLLGFVGGTASDGITVFSIGYYEGVNEAAKELGVNYELIQKLDAGFADAAVGSSFAQSVYTAGGNIVYSVAGNVGTGVTSKAADTKRLAIEVDANKDDVRPGNVLTSVLKNTNVPVSDLVMKYKDGTLKDSEALLNYTLKSGATGITDLSAISKKITADGKVTWDEIKTKVDAIRAKIENGEIKVTNAQLGEAFDPASLTNATIK
ncbi:MAG: BMP family ABC transporter substrate-binding protein [Tissierellia bacterium]|nr:BMP family ABC transporter substrate-binding protein [Tissierellia bacterium]